MEIRVLGMLEATEHHRSVLPSAAKPRQVFALLAVRAGRVVPVPTLFAELWGDRPPRSAHATLQTYVKQLRRLMRDAGCDALGTRFGGYVLDVPSTAVDVADYERLVEAGREAVERADHETAAHHFRAALDLWRGPALVDVPTGDSLSIEVTRLEDSRLSTVECRIDAELRCGRHHVLLSELAVLTARHPLNENLCAHHMTALARSGRQFQALEAYRTLRTTLVRELGVEPSSRLRSLHLSLL
ncbi:hypothetical protein GCM10022243_14730 [Saccharothrix violaceirubra]|uniref:DNA-binding SARP family transcriptional activator n=1 Tax=Saccharothrix violaceirubra TaxID=413306 RepID=A0A7W7T7B2_9PSEU|nr:AfsR/SARP family transcriptional regulator [Saccharothrix violaceirubra]MBB4967347.1 DNA-binding SARP family transcriptional activator [Saccharothrix violaceirubra]